MKEVPGGKNIHLLAIEDVAQYLNVPGGTIRKWARNGELPAFKLKHQWRIDPRTLERWLEAKRTGTPILPGFE